jgi:hypothetical protein
MISLKNEASDKPSDINAAGIGSHKRAQMAARMPAQSLEGNAHTTTITLAPVPHDTAVMLIDSTPHHYHTSGLCRRSTGAP